MKTNCILISALCVTVFLFTACFDNFTNGTETSDKIRFTKEPILETGVPTPADTEEAQITENKIERIYILNTSSKKFHYPSCASAQRISNKNKQEYLGTRTEILDKGYKPCGNCNP